VVRAVKQGASPSRTPLGQQSWPAGAVQSAPASAEEIFIFFGPAPKLGEGWVEKDLGKAQELQT
jgi:hypothetical protein